MLDGVIRFSLNNRLLVCLLSVVLVGLGLVALNRLPIDAFPDTTPVQVQINTVAPALNPLEIEQQITQFVELSIGGLPGLQNVRSVSKCGFSPDVATFDATADHPDWPEHLKSLVEHGRYRSLEIRKIDGETAGDSPWRPALEAAGYRDGYKGFVHRPPRPNASGRAIGS